MKIYSKYKYIYPGDGIWMRTLQNSGNFIGFAFSVKESQITRKTSYTQDDWYMRPGTRKNHLRAGRFRRSGAPGQKLERRYARDVVCPGSLQTATHYVSLSWYELTTHLLSIERTDWPKLHDMLEHWGRDKWPHFPDDIFECIFLN